VQVLLVLFALFVLYCWVTKEVNLTVRVWLPWDKRRHRLGLSHSVIRKRDPADPDEPPRPYLERWIVHSPLGTLRLHKFWRGDEDGAPHDHPWWFLTLPTRTYVERYWHEGSRRYFRREVRAWRLHLRRATHRHEVLGPIEAPFFTLVIGGPLARGWGFWPTPDKFVHWRVFLNVPPAPGQHPDEE
jgi:hypothetical protein